MKRSLLLFVLAALAAALVAVPATAAPHHTYRLRGTIYTTVEFGVPAGAMTVSGSGWVSPLGLVHSYGVQALAGDPAAVPQVGTVITGVKLVLTTADHLDRLYGTYTATVTEIALPRIAFTGHTVFSGGTGRFSGARGWAHLTGGYDFSVNRGYYTTDGWLTT